MRKITIYITKKHKKSISRKNFFLIAIILNIITTMSSIILLIPGIIALVYYFENKNCTKKYFKFFSKYNLIINIIYLILFCLGLITTILFDISLFIRLKLKEAFLYWFLIVFIIIIVVVQFWFTFIAKRFLKEIKIVGEQEKKKVIRDKFVIEDFNIMGSSRNLDVKN